MHASCGTNWNNLKNRSVLEVTILLQKSARHFLEFIFCFKNILKGSSINIVSQKIGVVDFLPAPYINNILLYFYIIGRIKWGGGHW